MPRYQLYGYRPSAFLQPEPGALRLDSTYDPTHDDWRYEIDDNGTRLSGDDLNDEVGTDDSQTGRVYDELGNLRASGNIYAEHVMYLRDVDDNIIRLYELEVDGTRVGYVADSPITPGVSYDFVGWEDVTQENARAYTTIHDNQFDPATANSIRGDDWGDDIRAGASDDTVSSGGGDDTIYGGDGNDILDGGAGNDRIYGEAGNDTLRGGAGSDTLTGGSGFDIIDVDSGGGDDVVTDFDIGDDDGDGYYNDQLDVSDLRTSDGFAVLASDVVVTDDGTGNARLTFPQGESIVLQGITPAQMSQIHQLQAAGIPCFARGTQIATPSGLVPVEDLKPGDLVLTRDAGPQPVRAAPSTTLTTKDLEHRPELRPVRIAADTFGNHGTLYVSPQHALAFNINGQPTFVRAMQLARMRGGRVRIATGVQSVQYVHLLLDCHQIIYANGLPAESFYPGPYGLSCLSMKALSSITKAVKDVTNYGAFAAPYARTNHLPDHISKLTSLGGTLGFLRHQIIAA